MGFWVQALPLPERSRTELRCKTACKPDRCWVDLAWRVGSEVVERDQLCMGGTELYISAGCCRISSPFQHMKTACAFCLRGISLQKQLVAPQCLEADRNCAALREIIKA